MCGQDNQEIQRIDVPNRCPCFCSTTQVLKLKFEVTCIPNVALGFVIYLSPHMLKCTCRTYCWNCGIRSVDNISMVCTKWHALQYTIHCSTEEKLYDEEQSPFSDDDTACTVAICCRSLSNSCKTLTYNMCVH